jgi:hypothetical protein
MPLSTSSKKKTAAPEKVASKKTDPSTDNANPPAKTDGQRKPDVVSDEPTLSNRWVAVKSFRHPVDGKDKDFVKGETTVSGSDPVLQEIPQLFEQVAG